MRENFAEYFDKPKFRDLLVRYEEMLSNGDTHYR
jgi:hypothetical protein